MQFLVRTTILVVIILVTNIAYGRDAEPTGLTDDQIRQRLITDSMNEHRGPCPCPYSKTRAGGLCGDRSAYSRPGGATPLCHPEDISPEIVNGYRLLERIRAKVLAKQKQGAG